LWFEIPKMSLETIHTNCDTNNDTTLAVELEDEL